MASEFLSVVSGGWSASQADLSRIPGPVIAVNSAALYAPKIDHAVTMDRRWAEAHWPALKAKNETGSVHTWFRRNNVCNIHERPDWLTIYQCDHKMPVMSAEPNTLNGTNSGGIALNLAYHLRPKRLLLFGFDYRPGPKGEPHWFEPTGETNIVGAYHIHRGRYANWAKQFSVAAEQFAAAGIDVINVSDTTVVTAFARISPKEYMRGVA